MVALVLISGCKEKRASSSLVSENSDALSAVEHPELSYSIVRHINIPLDKNEIQYDFQASQVHRNSLGSFEFWGLDAANNTFGIFDINTERFIKTIQIAKEGPRAINYIMNFVVYNEDSIYVMPGNMGRFYLINDKADVINKWDYRKTELPSGELLIDNFPFPLAELGTQFYYNKSNNSLLLPLFLHGGGELYQVPPIITLNLDEMLVVNNFGVYPDTYKGARLSVRSNMNFVPVEDGSVWLSFEESHQLQKYDSNGVLKSSVPAQSKFIDEDFVLYRKYPDQATRKMHWIQNGFYIGLHYDPFRKLIYRIAQHGQEEKDLNGRYNQVPMAPWSIITLDMEGKVLGETKMAGSKYRVNDGIYIVEDGILISCENKFNDEDKEEFLQFELIKINIENETN